MGLITVVFNGRRASRVLGFKGLQLRGLRGLVLKLVRFRIADTQDSPDAKSSVPGDGKMEPGASDVWLSYLCGLIIGFEAFLFVWVGLRKPGGDSHCSEQHGLLTRALAVLCRWRLHQRLLKIFGLF